MSIDKANIEAIYPLTPLQQGMLYHSQLDRSSSAYIEQLVWELGAGLDEDHFSYAWGQVIQRHGVFRTLFTGLDTKKPLQVVLKKVSTPWQSEDWSLFSTEEKEERLQGYLIADRQERFNEKEAPLMRLRLIKFSDNGYQFIWTHHHAILDGWSMQIVIAELRQYYAAAHAGKALVLPSVRPYQDYIKWLRKRDAKQAELYWQGYLKGFSAPTPLMNDRRNTSEASAVTLNSPAENYLFELPDVLTKALNSLVRQERITVNVVMQAVWALLLSRYSGEQDVVFGTIVSGRPSELEEVETMVGPFINTLPLRVVLEAGLEVRSLLKQLHRHCQTQLSAHEHTPLVDIQHWSDVGGGVPLFESLFVVENFPVDKTAEKQTSVDDFEVIRCSFYDWTDYPLAVLIGSGEKTDIRIQYNSLLFNHSTIERLANHYINLLEGIVARPQQKVFELSLLLESERHQQLYTWNDTKTHYLQNCCIHELFERKVKQIPDTVAIIYGTRQITYRELNQRSNQLACYLMERGLGAGSRVGIYTERSPETLIGMLAILKSGAAYVPIDPGYPEQRIQHIVSDASISILLTQETLVKKLSALTSISLICLDDRATLSQLKVLSVDNPDFGKKPYVWPSSLAYMVYTSGSTGQPKGVAIPHSNVISLCHWHQQFFDMDSQARATQVAGIGFDAMVWEVWPSLTAGVPLCIVRKNALLSSDQFIRYLNDERVTHSFVPTPIAEKLLRETWPAETTLRFLLTGGDKLNKTPMASWPFKLINNYGPTETTVVATSGEVNPDSKSIPNIGLPVHDISTYILGDNFQPVPVGAASELFVGGSRLAWGYLGQAGLTAEKFIPNPYSSNPGERLYCSGDIACYLADGNIEYLGRKDFQVSIRGFRVELGEIENTLMDLSDVQEAVVSSIQQEQLPRNQILVAYIVLEKGVRQEQEKLRQRLLTMLPDYMVPSLFVSLDEMPVTPNGKVDRKALPMPDIELLQTQEYVKPRSETEQLLVGIWSEVLTIDVSSIGVNDSFFELGGHSLLATQVVSLIRNSFDIEVMIQDVFSNSTARNLAAVIDQKLSKKQLAERLKDRKLAFEGLDMEEVTI